MMDVTSSLFVTNPMNRYRYEVPRRGTVVVISFYLGLSAWMGILAGRHLEMARLAFFALSVMFAALALVVLIRPSLFPAHWNFLFLPAVSVLGFFITMLHWMSKIYPVRPGTKISVRDRGITERLLNGQEFDWGYRQCRGWTAIERTHKGRILRILVLKQLFKGRTYTVAIAFPGSSVRDQVVQLLNDKQVPRAPTSGHRGRQNSRSASGWLRTARETAIPRSAPGTSGCPSSQCGCRCGSRRPFVGTGSVGVGSVGVRLVFYYSKTLRVEAQYVAFAYRAWLQLISVSSPKSCCRVLYFAAQSTRENGARTILLTPTNRIAVGTPVASQS